MDMFGSANACSCAAVIPYSLPTQKAYKYTVFARSGFNSNVYSDFVHGGYARNTHHHLLLPPVVCSRQQQQQLLFFLLLHQCIIEIYYYKKKINK